MKIKKSAYTIIGLIPILTIAVVSSFAFQPVLAQLPPQEEKGNNGYLNGWSLPCFFAPPSNSDTSGPGVSAGESEQHAKLNTCD